MDRREFLAAGVSGAALTTGLSRAAAQGEGQDDGAPFKLKYAPSPGQFKHAAGDDVLDQIRFAADQGFRAWEDNGLKGRSKDMQSKVGRLLEQRGMTMGVFVSLAAFRDSDFVTKTDEAYQDQLRRTMREAVAVAKRVGATWTTVVPGRISMSMPEAYQAANAVENLKVMAEVCEPEGLVMVLEPLNWWANHPGLFLRTIAQAYELCAAVDSPSCKILADLYHEQVQAGNLIGSMQQAWDHITYLQIADTPGRKEPLTGEINYRGVFGWLHSQGFEGVIGMEHGKSEDSKAGEQRMIRAYRWCDRFDQPIV